MTKSFKLVVNDKEYTVEIGDFSESPLTVVVNGEVYQVEVHGEAISAAKAEAGPRVVERPVAPRSRAAESPVTPRPEVKAVPGAVTAPLPCKVLEIKAKEGDQVRAGDVLFVAESMKMEITIPAPAGGVIKAIRVAVGQTVGQGVIMADME